MSAAETIWQLWQAGEAIDALAPGERPGTRGEGYAAQAGFEAFSPRAGWKIAATSAGGQAHIKIDGPIAGRVLAATVLEDGATVSLTGNRMRVAEPEFAFRFVRDLPPRATPYDVAEVLEAVADLHLTIELPDSRFTDFTAVGAPSLIADNACARELVVGPPVAADWRDVDLSRHPVQAEVAGRYTRDGIGAEVLGDPRAALTWLVGEVTGLGLTIAAGEIVTTGTCMKPLEVRPGDRVTADYGPFGRIGVTLAD